MLRHLVQSPLRACFHKSSVHFKTVPFVLADIGEGITEVEILQWHVKEGSTIRQFDKIAEVQSDKAAVEITSRFDGVVKKIYYTKGGLAKVGQPLIDIEVDGGGEASQTVAPKTETVADARKAPKVASSVHAARDESGFKTLPSVRSFAKANKVDLSAVQGSGKSGHITKEDVLAHISSAGPFTTDATASSSKKFETVSLNAFQKAMVKSMQKALQVPHFGYCDEICVDRLVHVKDDLSRKHSLKLTLMPFLIKALSLALVDYPRLNAHFEAESLTMKYFPSHNVCIAVDTEHGLAVPNIKHVELKSVLQISDEITRLTDQARSNKLGKEDLVGGTISLSNIGSIGGTTASPILVVPQVCIGAVGRIRKLPRFDFSNGQERVIAQSIMPVSWSADHRVVDGATMARFSNRVKGIVEDPEPLLAYLK